MEYYATERKQEFLPFATVWMEMETIVLREISQLVKDKHHMFSLIREIYKQTNEQNKMRGIESWNRLTAVGGEREAKAN